MKTLKREVLLQQLESVQPGLSERDSIEQSSCFILRGGQVVTFNEEIACSNKCPIGFEGAVAAAPLLAILRKLTETNVEVSFKNGELHIRGKRKKARVRCDAEISIPMDGVEKPGKWQKLNESFVDAVKLVQHCASTNDDQFAFTCLHVHPKYIEACDNAQMMRFNLKTGVKEEVLVRRDSIKHIVELGMIEFSETETWVHFRNPSGLVLSCRRFVDEYSPEEGGLDRFFNFSGSSITLPKGLAEAADKASIFAENADDPRLLIELQNGVLAVRGKGNFGSYFEQKKIKYSGDAMSFTIAPQLLKDITTRHNEAEITKRRLRVNGGNCVYVAFLGKPKKEIA